MATENHKQSAIDKLAACHHEDTETAHINADEVLCVFLTAIGHDDVAEAWKNVRDKTGFWYA